jgi:hypothetical protein
MNILELKRKLLPMSGPQMGGGSGGGGGSGTGTQTSISELPEWARGYAKNTLEKGAALSEQPYQTYNAPRIAGFSDLQKQAQASVGPQGFQSTVGQYMSPYQQNVTDIQKQEAARQSGIAGTQQAAQATQAGAFGGGRDAIMRAERERNLGRQMNEIQAIGSQNAYNAATNQYNTGLQQMSAFGGQQQALQQQGLSQAYQDFQNQQNQPYKQVGFMSDLIRGMPLGQQTAKSMYEPEPGMAQQIGSLGMGAYGLSKFMAEGGMAYADGGSVDSTDNVSRIVSKLSDQQLQQSAQAAQARGDMDQLEAIQSEMAMRASERNGIAGGVTNEMADRMAGGGVVAFAKGGLQDYMKTLSDLGNEDISATPEQIEAGVSAALPGVEKRYGPSALAPYMEDVKKERAGLSKMKDQGEGLAFLAASQALLRPGSKSRAISGAMGAFGTEIMKMEKEKREADRLLRQSEISLATAEQARADGLKGKAEAAYDKSKAQEKEALARKIGVAEKQATIAGGLEQANIQAAATLGKKTDLERLTATEYAALLESGSPDNAATRAQAGRNAANLYGKMAGTVRADMAAGKDRIKVAEAVDMMLMKPGVEKQRYRELQAADKAGGTNSAAEYRRSLIDAEMGVTPGADKGGPAPVQQSTTKGPDLNTFMVEARKANPGVSDADLKAYYNSKYK